jgi:galactitol-specific phosphotransferase system IIB component
MAVTKKATTTRKKASTAPAKTTTSVSETPSPMAVKVRKTYLVVGIAIIVIAALLYYFRSLFVAAIVNGQPISRFSLIQQLEKQGGKQVLNIAVTKTLIEQEARKKNISVSQKDIDNELKKTETSLAAQGQTLDQALAAQGMSRSDYADQVRLQQLIQKMVGKDITVSEKEVNDYLETNKGSIPEGSNMDQIKKSVRDQLRQQKLSTKIQSWIAQLQKDAKITYFLNY